MNRKFMYISIMIACAFFSAQAPENVKIDSLQNLLLTANEADSIELLLRLGEVYYQKENYPQALDMFFGTLKLSESENNTVRSADAANDIGRVFYNMENYSEALTYFNVALRYFKTNENEKRQGGVYNNIALIYYELDSIDLAVKYYQNALDIQLKYDQKLELATIYHNLGLIYMHEKQLEKAVDNLQSSRQIFVEEGYPKYAANTTNNIGRAYYRNEQYKEALTYFKQGLEDAQDENSAFLMMDNYKYQSDCYAKLLDYEQAYAYTNQYYTLKDSLLNIDKEKELAEIYAKYEGEMREQENQLLKNENEAKATTIKFQYIFSIGVFVIFILAVVLAIIYYRGNKTKMKANALLEAQKAEIVEKNVVLSRLNEEITIQNEAIIFQKKELEELNGIKDKLFSIISHEFRSPLNSLKGTLALLKVGALSDHDLNVISTELTDKINSTSIFLDNLLNWAKSQMQGINPNPVKLDICDVAEENITLLKSMGEKKKVHIKNAIPKHCMVMIDPNMINLILRNLVSNAIKFSLAGGTIELSSTPTGKLLKISVSDSGIGMTEENIKMLFQVQTFTTRGTANERGTGLGLFISKNFIESNGGSIWVESVEGKGSTFNFTVPLAS
jgi:two-component system sensor histidine kinase/response regulator